MKLLHIAGDENPTILMFGLGLIGGAVDAALRQRFGAGAQDYPYDWHDAGSRRVQRATIAAALAGEKPIAVVWSGGANGFGASAEEMDAEVDIVTELIDWVQSLQLRRHVAFHLISSAGGLFEGQTHCSASSTPNPLRPYGISKLKQEERLLAADIGRRHIYRPSSVYGVGRSKRLGLATMLATNALTGRTTRISGNPNTLRDYVLVDDIGRFMAKRIVDPSGTDDIVTMASGRPASVHEMVELVRARVTRPVMLQFDPHPSNAQHMSFLPSFLPSDWKSTALSSGIANVVDMLRKRLV